jgi:hypothetical protein
MKHQPTIAAADGGLAHNTDGNVNHGRDEVTTRDLYRAAWAASLGSALEYYDFALYNLASALIFGPLFFPSSDPAIGLIASFGAYFLGFAIRPVGGIVFGALGDRYGRKFVLMATILLMGVASTLIGVLPTYASAGIWAPVLLVGCRLLQGLGAGAEQAGAAVLMAEYAPAKRRGYFAALPFMGVLLGTVMAAAIYFALVRVEDISQSWLWRVPFLLSVLIIAVAIWIRLKLKESPSFSKLEAAADQRQPAQASHQAFEADAAQGHRHAHGGERRLVDLSVARDQLHGYRDRPQGTDRAGGAAARGRVGRGGHSAHRQAQRSRRTRARLSGLRAVSAGAGLSDMVGFEPGQRGGEHRDAVRRARGRLEHVRHARRAAARTLRRAASLRGRRGGARSVRRDRGRRGAADRRVDHRLGDRALGRQ